MPIWVLGVEEIPFGAQHPPESGHFAVEHPPLKIGVRTQNVAIFRFNTRHGRPRYLHESLKLFGLRGTFEFEDVVETPLVPDSVEQLLLRCQDLI
ncbi:hypothetical protein D9M73_293830 [compost metagenome]